jgi:hypothetical protein
MVRARPKRSMRHQRNEKGMLFTSFNVEAMLFERDTH